jgi:Amt family ammonium transporter
MNSNALKRLAILLFALSPVAASAQETAEIDTGDNAWMLVCSALVLMMTGPGLALFYGGLVRKKNFLSTMMQSFALMGVMTVMWAVYGYSMAFAPGSGALAPFVGGFDHLFLAGVGTGVSEGMTIPDYTFMVFQLMFAIITPALISGAFAERMKFSSMLVFTVLWATVVYFPMAHMVWAADGLMFAGALPCLDFAGGTVVHASSGISALVIAIALGKRKGYPGEALKPHNLGFAFIGACLLWVGWFGFNAGSALAANGLAAAAFVNTHFAASSALLAWLAIEWMVDGKPSMLGGITGAVAGLVAVTPASGFVGPMDALLIGLAAGCVCYFAVVVVKAKFGYDDSLDAFGVHGVGGTLGAILTGVFARAAVNGTGGLLEGNTEQFINNILGVGLTWVFAGVATYIIVKIIDATMGLRVDESEEDKGLDITQHGEEAYQI